MLERIYWLLEIISLAICISSIYGVKIKADIKNSSLDCYRSYVYGNV